MMGFGPNSGAAQMDIRFRNGTSAVANNSRWTGFARYGQMWLVNKHHLLKWPIQTNTYVNDSVAGGEAMNPKDDMVVWPENCPW